MYGQNPKGEVVPLQEKKILEKSDNKTYKITLSFRQSTNVQYYHLTEMTSN